MYVRKLTSNTTSLITLSSLTLLIKKIRNKKCSTLCGNIITVNSHPSLRNQQLYTVPTQYDGGYIKNGKKVSGNRSHPTGMRDATLQPSTFELGMLEVGGPASFLKRELKLFLESFSMFLCQLGFQ